MEQKNKYCICCGEDVPYEIVFAGGKKEFLCSYCGFMVGIEDIWEGTKISKDTCALIADDSKFTRLLLRDLIMKKTLAGEVFAFENGLDLLSAYSKMIKTNAKILFAIIDLNMPVMDGLTAARSLRAIEETQGLKKIPIVFFSGMKADANLRKQLEMVAPANYINKGSDTDPKQLAQRVQVLLNFIVHHQQQSTQSEKAGH